MLDCQLSFRMLRQDVTWSEVSGQREQTSRSRDANVR